MPRYSQCRRCCVFIINFEHISHLCSSVSIINFELVNAGWERKVIYVSGTHRDF